MDALAVWTVLSGGSKRQQKGAELMTAKEKALLEDWENDINHEICDVNEETLYPEACQEGRTGRNRMRKWDIEHAHGMHVARKPEQLKDAFEELSEEEAEQYENFIMQVVGLLLEEN